MRSSIIGFLPVIHGHTVARGTGDHPATGEPAQRPHAEKDLSVRSKGQPERQARTVAHDVNPDSGERGKDNAAPKYGEEREGAATVMGFDWG